MKRGSHLQRRSPMRRARFKRSARRSKYARRPRDWDFMSFVRGQVCSVGVEPPDPDRAATAHAGDVQADHAGRRGIGQKADDTTCIPMCSKHHGERTDHTGSFKRLTRDQVRAWIARAISRTQTTYQEHRS